MQQIGETGKFFCHVYLQDSGSKFRVYYGIATCVTHKISNAGTLEIGYSDTVYLSKNCHCNRLFLYQIILL